MTYRDHGLHTRRQPCFMENTITTRGAFVYVLDDILLQRYGCPSFCPKAILISASYNLTYNLDQIACHTHSRHITTSAGTLDN